MSDIIFTKYHLKKEGGLEKYSLKIIDKYLEKGKYLTLLTTEICSDLKNKKNLKIIFFKIPKFFKFFKLRLFDFKCQKWIKKNKPKIVFSLDRTSSFTHTRLGNGLHSSYLKRKKIFENAFQLLLNFINPKNRLILNLEKKGFKQPNLQKIIVNSNMVLKELSKNYTIAPSKIEIIHNGVEFYEMENDFNNWEIQKSNAIKKLNLQWTDYHFIFIGNDYKRKGLIFLLKALANIKEKPFHLSVIGKEKKIKKFKNFVKNLKIENKVSFFGKRDDIAKFYQLADALIIPTYYDPFSNVVLEALSMGVFTLTSEFNGAKEILNDENGMIADILDINSFTKAIEFVMKTKKDTIRAKMIRNSVEHLDFSKQLNKLIKIINI